MYIIHAILLAIIEGLTEFLPISSTAHMKMVDFLIGIPETPFRNMYEVVIQFAAILAVVLLYWKKFFDFKNINFYVKLLIAVIPALVFGAILKKHIDAALSNLMFIAIVMIVGGIILLFVDKLFTKNKIQNEQQIDITTAFKIGCFQVLSIIFPGLSRSAATIVGGMSIGLTRKAAAEFSFFLAVPTMFAASAKSMLDVFQEGEYTFVSADLVTLLVGCVISFIVAFLAVKFFIEILQKFGFKFFGFYRIILGSIILILLLIHK
ncbi:MAG: undecaprenyl-diphosphate phosphatase [Chitinophagales bacterium]|jgi:undecaprenyl-diphosphatase|nr:undecaprenyl-diphosphate phosphatase [Chitinophagales bacterium]